MFRDFKCFEISNVMRFQMVRFQIPTVVLNCHMKNNSLPNCLVESHSQDAATNAGVLSVYLTTILDHHHQLFTDIDRENIPCVNSLFHC